jgi:prevent-host-death family protein
MAQVSVGVRELKAKLGRYLRDVAAGNTVIITDRGRPIGQIVPFTGTLESRLQQLASVGLVAWNGNRLAPVEAATPTPDSPMVSDLLLEDRD